MDIPDTNYDQDMDAFIQHWIPDGSRKLAMIELKILVIKALRESLRNPDAITQWVANAANS